MKEVLLTPAFLNTPTRMLCNRPVPPCGLEVVSHLHGHVLAKATYQRVVILPRVSMDIGECEYHALFGG